MKTSLLLLVMLATPLPAQGWFGSQRTFSLYEENDAISATGDESYTQGIRFTWDFLEWPTLAHRIERNLSLRGLVDRLPGISAGEVTVRCAPQRTRGVPSIPCGSVSFGLGQTIFTPNDILSGALQTADRPYAGWLYANLGINVRDGRWQSSTDFVIGMIGPQSHAQSTQSLAHWTWAQGSPEPRGWHHQLRNAFHVGIIQSIGYHVIELCRAGCTGAYDEKRWFDLTPRAELIAGSFMQRGSVGATVRIGKRFPDALIGQRIPATGRPMEVASSGGQQWWWALIASAEQRAVGFNALLEGSYTDDGPNDWRARRGISRLRGTDEWTLGLGAGNRSGSLTAQWVSRSPEWRVVDTGRTTGRHAFVTILLAIHAGS